MDINSFIKTHKNEDPAILRLKYNYHSAASPHEAEMYETAITQIECRRKYATKFRKFFSAHPDFRFPDRVSAEQASHELVSELHARILEDSSLPFIDMTAGLGIDFVHISSILSVEGRGCTAIEINPHKASVLNENITSLGLPLANIICGDSMEFLNGIYKKGERAGLIFADPARRTSDDFRLYNPYECFPDVVGKWEMLLKSAERIAIKNSPMLDIHKAVELYPGAEKIYVVSVRNECKEVFVVASRDGKLESIECINILAPGKIEELSIPASKLSSRRQDSHMVVDEEYLIKCLNEVGECYLYEPDSSVMKVMPWNLLAEKYKSEGLTKLSPNCHLFLSNSLIEDFPGRKMHVNGLIDKREKKRLKNKCYNVVCRNYPLRADELAKSLKIKSSEKDFIYGITYGQQEIPALIQCRMIEK